MCAACRTMRSPDDLLAFHPVGDPDRVRFVCRPTRPTMSAFLPCFARVVGRRTEHAIRLAGDRPALTLVTSPVRPNTEAWGDLLRSAGVRAA